jgi:hypothetical protein
VFSRYHVFDAELYYVVFKLCFLRLDKTREFEVFAEIFSFLAWERRTGNMDSFQGIKRTLYPPPLLVNASKLFLSWRLPIFWSEQCNGLIHLIQIQSEFWYLFIFLGKMVKYWSCAWWWRISYGEETARGNVLCVTVEERKLKCVVPQTAYFPKRQIFVFWHV